MILLAYDDFGPPVIANEVLGSEWWQWQSHGDSRPNSYDVKVVVYRGKSKSWISKKFQINSDKNQDYRYLEYGQAIKYLDEKISENIMESVTERLKETHEKIVATLGS